MGCAGKGASRPRGTAYLLNGTYLMRPGEALVPMSEDQLRRIFAEGEPDRLEDHSRTGQSAQQVIDALDTQAFFELLKLPYPDGARRGYGAPAQRAAHRRDRRGASASGVSVHCFSPSAWTNSRISHGRRRGLRAPLIVAIMWLISCRFQWGAARLVPRGDLISSTIMVMMTARTPSLKASRRPLFFFRDSGRTGVLWVLTNYTDFYCGPGSGEQQMAPRSLAAGLTWT